MARGSLWVPTLLSSLALVTVVGGVAVGHFYWTSLRVSLDRMETSMGEARERQHTLLTQIDRTRDVLGDQEQRLRREAEALHRHEEAVAEQRRQLEREREALERILAERRAEAETAARLAERLAVRRLRLGESAELTAAAAQDLTRDRAAAGAALAAADALLGDLDTADAAGLRERLAALRTRAAPPDTQSLAALTARLDAALARAERLPAMGNARAWSSRPNRRLGDPATTPTRGVALQLQAARFALQQGEWRLYGEALETARLWLGRFFDERRPEAAELAREVAGIEAAGPGGDPAALAADLTRLAADLAAAAETPAPALPAPAAPALQAASPGLPSD